MCVYVYVSTILGHMALSRSNKGVAHICFPSLELMSPRQVFPVPRVGSFTSRGIDVTYMD